MTQSVTGLFVTMQNGSDIIAEEFQPFISASFPIVPDQMYFSDVSAVGDRLVVKARNPSGGAITINTIAQITALAGQ